MKELREQAEKAFKAQRSFRASEKESFINGYIAALESLPDKPVSREGLDPKIESAKSLIKVVDRLNSDAARGRQESFTTCVGFMNQLTNALEYVINQLPSQPKAVMPEKMPNDAFMKVHEILHNYNGDRPELDIYQAIRTALTEGDKS